jgi:hypothetical protein
MEQAISTEAKKEAEKDGKDAECALPTPKLNESMATKKNGKNRLDGIIFWVF